MNKHSQNGMTLVEILVVVMILSVLAAMVIPNVAGKGEQARQAAARADIDSNLSVALDLFRLDNGRFPTTEQGLLALIEKPDAAPAFKNWDGPYLKKSKVPADPWGNPYFYVAPGAHNAKNYDLASLGPDGIESSDDIFNWETNETK